MAQILNRPSSWQQLLGSGIGSGLSQNLNKLAENKINDMNRRNETSSISQGLSSILPPDEAQKIAQLPQKQQEIFLKNFLPLFLQGNNPEQKNDLEDKFEEQSPLSLLNTPPNLVSKKELSVPEESPSQIVNKEQETSRKIIKNGPEEIKQQINKEPIGEKKKSVQEVAKIRQSLRKQQEDSKEQRIRQREINKELSPLAKEIRNEYKASIEGNKRLDIMEQLVNKGTLSDAGWSAIVKAASLGGYGIDLSNLLTADTQLFDKLSNEFIKEGKAWFGSRMTDQDLKALMKTVPQSTQSDTAKRLVIENLRTFNKAKVARKKAFDEIVSENGGNYPPNLDALIDEKAGPELDKLTAHLKDNIAKSKEPNIREQNREMLDNAIKSITDTLKGLF